MYDIEKTSVCLFYDIRLCHTFDPVLSVGSGEFKSHAGDPLRSLGRRHFKVDAQIVGNIYAAASHDIFAFRILPVKCPVDTLFRNADRPDVSEEIQFPAESYVALSRFGIFIVSLGVVVGPFKKT